MGFAQLKEEIKTFGLRNSLLVAPMPTASTAQILGNNECFEPFTSNLYKRNTLSGEYTIVNKYLVEDLVNLDLWDEEMRMRLIMENGSIQNVPKIPQDVRDVYKTVWEMKGKNLLEMSRDRGYFIDQSQSFNMFMEDASVSKLTSAHFYGWKLGLKTGMYYLRTKPKAQALKGLGVDTSLLEKTKVETPVEETPQCKLDDPDCLVCGS